MSASAARRSQPRFRLHRWLGSRLATDLAWPHGVDGHLQAVAPAFAVDAIRARVTSITRPTADSVTLRLAPNANWSGHRAGQYVRLTVEVDGRRLTRCYSPVQAESDTGEIELTARTLADGRVSRYLRDGLAVGEVVDLSPAEGCFALPQPRPSRILLISAGSGITPVLSMLRTLCSEAHRGEITFVHFARSRADALYADALAALAARHPNLRLLRGYADDPDGGEWPGRFSAQTLERLVPDYREAEAFLCGPPALSDAVEALWSAEGIAARLHREHFVATRPALPAAPVDTAAGAELHFARSHRRVSGNGASLLDQAEAAGLAPESGCRMGICHACTCRKVSGRVRDLRTGVISDAAEADIQLCVSVPVGAVTLDL